MTRWTLARYAAQLRNWCSGVRLLQDPIICFSVYRDRFILSVPFGPDDPSS